MRREHLQETGRRVRPGATFRRSSNCSRRAQGLSLSFFVVSAAPREVIQSALEASFPGAHHRTELEYDAHRRITFDRPGPRGYGKGGGLEFWSTGLASPPIEQSTWATAVPTCT